MELSLLQTLWFILIAVLFAGFFFLEGFDYGVGILLPFVANNDKERRVVVNAIGPFWDGNEVWLLTAGGAMFAAFPQWYATMFSGFYLALFLVLVGLILRGIAFEFRSKVESPRWRALWDWAIFIGSVLPALLFGVAFANIVRGVPIDENMTYTGTLFTLLNPYGLLGGVVTLTLFVLHGALFLEMKSDGVVQERAGRIVKQMWLPVTLVALAFVGYSYFETSMFTELTLFKIIGLAGAVGGLVFADLMILSKRYGRAFIGTGLAAVFVVVLLFATLFPNVMISSTNAANNISIAQASSSEYTLGVMTIIALTLVPIVLAYQAWTYWVFRKRVTSASHLEY